MSASNGRAWRPAKTSYHGARAVLERRLDVLRSLAPGEIAPPPETHVGFEIIMRTSERPRPRFAAELLSIPFNPWAAESEPNTRNGVLAKSREIATC